MLQQFAAGGTEQARQAAEITFSLENALKAYTGEYTGLLDPKIMSKKAADERALRDAVAKNPEWQKTYASAWDDIARAETANRRYYKEQRFGQLRGSGFAGLGLAIVRYVTETRKPDGERLNGYHDAQLPSLQFWLLSPAPIYPALETALLADALQESLEELGPDSPFIKAVLAGRSPKRRRRGHHRRNQARRSGGSQAVARRRRGGRQAINRSVDCGGPRDRPDPARHQQADRKRGHQRRIRRAPEDRPGAVRGVRDLGLSGCDLHAAAFVRESQRVSDERHACAVQDHLRGPVRSLRGFDGKPPFDLVPRFAEGRAKLDLSTPLDMVTTNDIIGGNSGSPVVNKAGELVGLIFDGNIESLVGRFVYDETANRAVAVHSGAIVHVLRTIYGAGALADELDPPADKKLVSWRIGDLVNSDSDSSSPDSSPTHQVSLIILQFGSAHAVNVVPAGTSMC